MTQAIIKNGISAEMNLDTDGSSAVTKLSSGYGATQNLASTDFDQVCSEDIDLAAAGTYTIDLQAIVNDVNVTVDLADVSAVYVRSTGFEDSTLLTASTAQIAVGGAATNAFVGFVGDVTDTILVDAGQALSLTAGATAKVVSPTDKDILITNLDGVNPIAIKVVVIGTKV